MDRASRWSAGIPALNDLVLLAEHFTATNDHQGAVVRVCLDNKSHTIRQASRDFKYTPLTKVVSVKVDPHTLQHQHIFHANCQTLYKKEEDSELIAREAAYLACAALLLLRVLLLVTGKAAIDSFEAGHRACAVTLPIQGNLASLASAEVLLGFGVEPCFLVSEPVLSCLE